MKEKFETAKEKAKDFRRKAAKEVKRFGSEAVEFADRNKGVLIAIAPIAIAGIRSSQSLIVSHRVNKERKRIDHSYYDRSTNMYWDLKRKLSNAEKAEVVKRKEAGEPVYDILRQMKVLR